MDLLNRPRRLRISDTVRKMIRETRASVESIIYPVFIKEGKDIYEPIESLDGQFRYSPDKLNIIAEKCIEKGINKILLFGIPKHKDETASSAYDDNGVIQQGIRELKKNYPNIYIITDICMCEYTSHGHCGILNGNYVDNDITVKYLNKIALSYAKAGADMAAPSDMMDGRILAMRKTFDENGFINFPIMAYSAKYASSFYGPFRDAAGSAPSFGDRKSYQMDPHNSDEAILECELDIKQGADIIMVKPALSYLDVVYRVKERFNIPLCVYSVSGEYSMIKNAGKMGLIDEYKVMCESTVSMLRAGADMIISYYAFDIADAIRKGDIG